MLGMHECSHHEQHSLHGEGAIEVLEYSCRRKDPKDRSHYPNRKDPRLGQTSLSHEG